jgi:hypothetical protein
LALDCWLLLLIFVKNFNFSSHKKQEKLLSAYFTGLFSLEISFFIFAKASSAQQLSYLFQW